MPAGRYKRNKKTRPTAASSCCTAERTTGRIRDRIEDDSYTILGGGKNSLLGSQGGKRVTGGKKSNNTGTSTKRKVLNYLNKGGGGK